MHKALWAGVAVGVLMASSVQAQVQTGPGFFGYLDGMYALPLNTGYRTIPRDRHRTGSVWGFDAKAGYRFDAAWDIALGGRYVKPTKGKPSRLSLFGWDDAGGQYWNIDGEVGYTLSGPGWGVRPFLGVRYQRWKREFTSLTLPLLPFPTARPMNYENESWGIGPRLGIDGSFRLDGPLSLFGGVDTAFLFGRNRQSERIAPTPAGLGGFSAASSKRWFVWDIGAKIGLDWEVTPLFHIAVGYRVDWLRGIHSTYIGFVDHGSSSNELIHGPFVRLAYNWGAPPRGVVEPAPSPVSASRSFIVFFDFDRASLTATAVQTIKLAAEQAKAGRATRIDVTGHADRAGADAYNMALSLRRANAVKDQLVREGLGVSQIAVVGRGESQPLVPTADGVREPQNRRVEIVIN